MSDRLELKLSRTPARPVRNASGSGAEESIFMPSPGKPRTPALPLAAAAALLAAAPAGAASRTHLAGATRAPAAAPVVSIQVYPTTAVLDGPKSRQQLLVTGVREDNTLVDLTGSAKYASKAPRVATVSASGVVQPLADGTGALAVSAAGKSASVRVT